MQYSIIYVLRATFTTIRLFLVPRPEKSRVTSLVTASVAVMFLSFTAAACNITNEEFTNRRPRSPAVPTEKFEKGANRTVPASK